MILSTTWKLTKQTLQEWSEDKASRLSASLTYYTLFSLAPLLLIAIAVVGFIFGKETAQAQIRQQLQQQAGEQVAAVVQTMIVNAGRHGSGLIATIVAVVLVVYGATNVFAELQDAMDTIWEVQPKPGLGVWETVRSRFLSFAMVLGIALLLLASVIVSAVLTGLRGTIGGGGVWLGHVANIVVSLAVFTVLFAMLFKFLPDAKVYWRDVWLGAFVTAVLFNIGKFLIGWYLGRGTVSSVYGAAGSLVALLVWVYYSAQILFLGAEFTQVYARYRGEQIEPDENAIRMTDQQRAHLGIPHRAEIEAEEKRQEETRVVTVPVRRSGWMKLAGMGMLMGIVVGRWMWRR